MGFAFVAPAWRVRTSSGFSGKMICRNVKPPTSSNPVRILMTSGDESPEKAPPISRRNVLARGLSGVSAALISAVIPAAFESGTAWADETAVAGELVDTVNYSFQAPSGFTKTIASLSGGRIATIFVADDDQDTNVTMVETGVPSDFQKLTSFGSVDNFISTVVPTSVAGNKLISVKDDSRKNAYIVEYILKPSGTAKPRHLITVFSLQPGQYLFTLTGQCADARWDAKKNVLLAAADSFIIKPRD
jgi:PsbP